MVAKVAAVVVAVAGVLVWQLGLFDRPKFEFQESLLPEEQHHHRELYAIVAVAKGNIASQVGKLATGTLKGIEESLGPEDSKELLGSAAKLWPGTPEGSEKLSVGLYFDNPKAVAEERWAIGWAVESHHGGFESGFHKVQAMVDKIQAASGLTEPIRAVRIRGSALKAQIPWRNFFTPMIQPMLQWTRAFQTYENEGHKNDPKHEATDEAIALEVYVSGPNDSYHHIDYVLLFGDTHKTWGDCFPDEQEYGEGVVADE